MKGKEMELQELIKSLEGLPDDHIVDGGFGSPMSWRGSYCELSFLPVDTTTIGDMLAHARSALGTTYQGYKGGDFTMHPYTDCYIAEYGECGEPITSAHLKMWAM